MLRAVVVRPAVRERGNGVRRQWRTVLAAAGTTLENIVDCTVFLGSMDDYDALNEAYTAIFPKDPPARAAFGAAGIAMNAAAEFKCVATL